MVRTVRYFISEEIKNPPTVLATFNANTITKGSIVDDVYIEVKNFEAIYFHERDGEEMVWNQYYPYNKYTPPQNSPITGTPLLLVLKAKPASLANLVSIAILVILLEALLVVLLLYCIQNI